MDLLNEWQKNKKYLSILGKNINIFHNLFLKSFHSEGDCPLNDNLPFTLWESFTGNSLHILWNYFLLEPLFSQSPPLPHQVRPPREITDKTFRINTQIFVFCPGKSLSNTVITRHKAWPNEMLGQKQDSVWCVALLRTGFIAPTIINRVLFASYKLISNKSIKN